MMDKNILKSLFIIACICSIGGEVQAGFDNNKGLFGVDQKTRSFFLVLGHTLFTEYLQWLSRSHPETPENLVVMHHQPLGTPVPVHPETSETPETLVVMDEQLPPDTPVPVQVTLTPFMQLHKAVCDGNVKLVKQLLEAGVNPNTINPEGGDAWSLLHIALTLSHRRIRFHQKILSYQEIVDLLLKHEANPRYKILSGLGKGQTPIDMALSYRNIDILLIFWSRGILNEQEQEEFLFIIVMEGDVNILKALLECGVNPNISNSAGEQPLHCAAKRGDMNILKALLECGANPNIRNSAGKKPLHHAVKRGYMEMVKTLLECGVKVYMTLEEISDIFPLIQVVYLTQNLVRPNRTSVEGIDPDALVLIYYKHYLNNMVMCILNAQSFENAIINIVNRISATVIMYSRDSLEIDLNELKELINGLIEALNYVRGSVDSLNNADHDILLKRIDVALEALKGCNF